MKRSWLVLVVWIPLFLLCASAPVGAEVHLTYENLAFRSGKSFSFHVPADLKDIYYSYSGRGRSSMTVTACRVPTNLNDNKNGMHSGVDLTMDRQYPVKMRSFVRNQRPDLQNCDWGVYVGCLDNSGCSGKLTIWWDRWDGSSSRGTGAANTENASTSGQSASGSGVATVTPPSASATDIGDAGTNNNDAALIGYGCQLEGHLRQGDYDNYTFFFPGGAFRALSESSLNLVADLLDSKGQRVARSGVDTPQFDIQGNYPQGKYFLIVRVMHHGGTGAYRINLGPDNGCRVVERP